MKNTTYARRKIRAIERINALYDKLCVPGVSWHELAVIYGEIDDIARRYGLLTEMRDNGIL